jgi:predicted AAA+ superfamily ATPase
VQLLHADRLWVRGGFPKAFLARSERESMEWRQAFIRIFLERDLPALAVNIAADTMRRFWSMLAHHHAQLWNASEMGRSFGVADTTVRNYLDKLTDALVVRQLKPWHENLGKRQVKSPKIFIRDSGLLHALLNLPTKRDIEGHPKLGASWEGFIIDQLVQQLGVSRGDLSLANPSGCRTGSTRRARRTEAGLRGQAYGRSDAYSVDALGDA